MKPIVQPVWICLLSSLAFTTGCSVAGQGDPQIVIEGQIDESLPQETRQAQETIKRLLNAAREDSVSPESLRFLAPGITLEESVDAFLEGHQWLARWEFGSGASKGRVPVILYFSAVQFHWGDPSQHIRVERVYEVKRTGSRTAVKRISQKSS